MKKHLYHLLVFSLLGIFAASCSDDDDAPNIQSEIVGEWRLTSWSENAPEGFEVYVEFTSAATFGLYQKVETSNYTKYTGRYSIDGSRPDRSVRRRRELGQRLRFRVDEWREHPDDDHPNRAGRNQRIFPDDHSG